MKKILLPISCLLLLALTNCKKDKHITLPHQTSVSDISVSDIIDSLVGSYTGTDYQFSFGGSNTHFDTLYNQSLSISKFNDSVIVANSSDTLRFVGNLTNKDYRFDCYFNNGYSDKFIFLDSTFRNIYFTRTTGYESFGGTNFSLVVTR